MIIKINDKRILEIEKSNIIKIKETFLEEPYKDYIMIYSDDYSFSGFIDNININEITFDFDINHPLYNSLLCLLRDDKEIKIASDFKEFIYDELCYIKIYIENDIIYISFVNNIKEEKNSIEKFDYEIKNIMFDLRSKLDSNRTDIKDRINLFFNESVKLIDNKIKKK